MDKNLELTEKQINEVSQFIQVTVLDNSTWDDLVDKLRLCLDTAKGRKFVHSALDALTFEITPDDLQANVERMAAPIAMGFTDTAVLCENLTKEFNPLRNKRLINQLLHDISIFSPGAATDQFCHACGNPRIINAVFCNMCGVKYNYPIPAAVGDHSSANAQNAGGNPSVHAQNAGVQDNMNAIASLLVAQSQLLSKISVSQGKGKAKRASQKELTEDDESSDFSDGSPHANYAVPLWHEGKLSNRELNMVILQFDYPLNTFLKRAATNVAKSLLIIKQARGRVLSPEEYQDVGMQLSSAIRDVQEDILQPGGKPAQQDVEALALLGITGITGITGLHYWYH